MLDKIKRYIKKRQDLQKNQERSESKLEEIRKEEAKMYRQDDDLVFGRQAKGIESRLKKENELIEKYKRRIQGMDEVIMEAISKFKDETQDKMTDGANNMVLEHKSEWSKHLDILKEQKKSGMKVDRLKMQSQLSLQAAVGFGRRWSTKALLNLFENKDYDGLDLPTAIGLGLEKEFTEYRKNLVTTIERETRKGKEIKKIEVKKRKELKAICAEWVRKHFIPEEIATSQGIDQNILFAWFEKTGNHPSEYNIKPEGLIKKKIPVEVVS